MKVLQTPPSSRVVAAAIALNFCLAAPVAVAASDFFEPLTTPQLREINNGAMAMLNIVSKVAAENRNFNRQLKQIQSSFTIVFVPGIMGSSIIKNGAVIWGDAIPDTDELKLEPDLIDHQQEDPNTRVELLREALTLDMYGKAVHMLEKYALRYGVQYVLCPFDWRRDIRVAAQRLENVCLKNIRASTPSDSPVPFIIVAHSMGGVVTWAWHQQHYKNYSPREKSLRRLQGVAVLGSPLLGSCEMLRMIERGYVQPHESWVSEPDDYLDRFGESVGNKIQIKINAITSLFTQNLRSALLTWPGAFELTPMHSTERAGHCLPLPNPNNPPGSDDVLSYYELIFWNTELGKDLRQTPLGKYIDLPVQFDAVLAKAREFRDWFKPGPLSAPVMNFYSSWWATMQGYIVTPGGRLTASDPNHIKGRGDGRVTVKSAKASGYINSVDMEAWAIPSAHGDLPSDPIFKRDFYELRLPQIINGHMAVAAAEIMSKSRKLLRTYSDNSGQEVPWESVEALLEGLSKEKVSAETWRGRDIVKKFNSAIRETIRLPEPTKARAKTIRTSIGMGTKVQNWIVAVEYGSDSIAKKASFRERIQNVAQVGLALARAGDWYSAVGPLKNALNFFDKIPVRTKGGKTALEKLKRKLMANLGFALYQVGKCKNAEGFYRLTQGNPNWASHLQRACEERETSEKIIFK